MIKRKRQLVVQVGSNADIAKALIAHANAALAAEPLQPAVAAEVLKAAGAFSISAALDRILQLIVLEIEKEREAEAAREKQKGGRP
jgi:hypothetical protein